MTATRVFGALALASPEPEPATTCSLFDLRVCGPAPSVSRSYRVLHPKVVSTLDEYRAIGGLAHGRTLAGDFDHAVTNR